MSSGMMQLAFTPRLSRRFACVLASLHGALALLWVMACPPWPVLCGGLVLIALGWRAAVRESSALVRDRVVLVAETPGSRFPWRIEREDGSAEGAVLESRGIVCPLLIAVSLVTARRRYLCVLAADNASPDVHRRLRIRLRHARAMPATNV